jgi:hypothetical protein
MNNEGNKAPEGSGFMFPFALPKGELYCTITLDRDYSEAMAAVSFEFIGTVFTQKYPKKWEMPNIYGYFPSEEPQRVIFMNKKLLSDALLSCSGNYVRIELRDGLKPIMLSSAKSERFIVLPLQNKDETIESKVYFQMFGGVYEK